MFNLFADLPDPRGHHGLPFVDARECKEWLKSVPVLNVTDTQRTFLRTLEGLNKSEILVLERLKILEMMRENIYLVQAEQSKRYAGRSVPLDKETFSVWERTCELWAALESAYRQVLKETDPNDVVMTDHTALVAQRVLRAITAWMSQFHVIYRPVSGALWSMIHAVYLNMEDIAAEPVKDSLLDHVSSTSIQAAYVHALFLDLANPLRMSFKNYRFVDGLLQRWARKVSLQTKVVEDRLGSLAVSLQGREGAQPAELLGQDDFVRWIDRRSVVVSLQKRIKSLREDPSGKNTADGDAWLTAGGLPLLKQLYFQWCDNGNERLLPRRKTDQKTMLTGEWQEIYSHIAGMPFKAPEDAVAASSTRRDMDIIMFGRSTSEMFRSQSRMQAVPLSVLEAWQVDDESATGCRVSHDAPQSTWQFQQLILMMDERNGKAIAIARRLKYDEDGSLEMGLELLPGKPQAASVRPLGALASQVPAAPALLMPEVPALKRIASLLVPSGYYQRDREYRLYLEDGTPRVRITHLIDRGANYEQCGFEVVS